uniref:Protein kinase domain-containing protein n=1 Tax=Oryza glumipatula TaxID=40148 RepID=A0A0E0AS03_9ORYZ
MACCFMFGNDTKQTSEGEQGEKAVRIFSYNELRRATHDFSGANKIGEGGFGSVFRGRLRDGTIVAVKVLSATSRQGVRSGRSNIQFNWRARVKITVGVARGLAFLHEEVRPHIIHRDIKASNILLDKDITPKISDFGLARLLPPNATHVSTRVAGTIGYLAPEYALRGQVTKKSDIYSFGVLILEIVSGRCNYNSRLPYEEQFLLERTWTCYEQGHLEEIIDADIEDDVDVEEACRFLKVGLLCTQDAMKLRPNMINIVRMLTGEKDVNTERITKPSVVGDLGDLRGSSQQRPSDPQSLLMRSFATTDPSTSSDTTTRSSL